MQPQAATDLQALQTVCAQKLLIIHVSMKFSRFYLSAFIVLYDAPFQSKSLTHTAAWPNTWYHKVHGPLCLHSTLQQ